jgi:hypothetical protein
VAKSPGSSRKPASARSARASSSPAAAPRPAAAPVAAPAPNAREAAEPVIVVPAGSRLEILVDVGPMTVPYTVAYADRTILKSRIDQVVEVRPLESGRRTLAWVFMHMPKGSGWSHTVAYAIDGGRPVVLESMSEANNDPDTRIGIAFVDA